MSENPEAGLLARSPDESQSSQFPAATLQRPSSPALAVPPLESSSRPPSPARQVLGAEPSPAIQDFHVKSSQVTAPPDDQSSPALTPPRTASPVSQVPSTRPSLLSLADTFPSTGSSCRLLSAVRNVSPTESSPKARAIPTRKPIFDDIMQSAEDALKNGQYNKALQEFDKLICMRPENANCRIHRADILLQLGRHADALTEYDEVYQLYPEDGGLQEKLSLFHLSLGDLDVAELYLTHASPACKKDISAKIEKVKDHLTRAKIARKDEEWIIALGEVNAAIAEGANISQPILALKAEILLRLDQFHKAEETIFKALKLETELPTLGEFLGMVPEAYAWAVHAQIEMASGRFGNAVTAAERAQRIDQFSNEVIAIQTNVLLANRARIYGHNHYDSGDYMRACDEYKTALKYAKSNRFLLTSLACCYWKLERWEQCVEVCNQVLQVWPNNSRVLLLRTTSYNRLTN